MPEQMPVDLHDLYKLIGEREVIRFYQEDRIRCLQKMVDDLYAENLRLQAELRRVKLEQSPVDHAIRHLLGGDEGEGR